jgi:hypothetical protein
MNNNINGTSLLDLTQMTQLTQYNPPQTYQQPPPQQPQNFQHDDDYIKNISQDILKGLSEDNISLSDTGNFVAEKKTKIKNKDVEQNKNYINEIFKKYINVKEFLALLLLYIILSTEYVKNFFASYITCLNPDDQGVISITGIIAYGVILCSLFVIIRIIY